MAIFVAAHSIGNGPNADFRMDQITVLVALSHLAYVCRGAGFKRYVRHLHRQSSHLGGRSQLTGQHPRKQQWIGHAPAAKTDRLIVVASYCPPETSSCIDICTIG